MHQSVFIFHSSHSIPHYRTSDHGSKCCKYLLQSLLDGGERDMGAGHVYPLRFTRSASTCPGHNVCLACSSIEWALCRFSSALNDVCWLSSN